MSASASASESSSADGINLPTRTRSFASNVPTAAATVPVIASNANKFDDDDIFDDDFTLEALCAWRAAAVAGVPVVEIRMPATQDELGKLPRITSQELSAAVPIAPY